MEENGSKAMSVVSLVLGIISMLCCCIGFPFAIVGIILAIIALVKKKNGKGLAIAGLITSAITLVISIFSAISLIPLAPYFDGYMDFVENAPAYAEEYEEYGTYPPFMEDLIEDGKIPEEQAEQIMDQLIKSIPASSEE